MKIQKHNLETITADFFASITVFLIALPLCLGIALASNASLIAGLLSGIIGGIIVGILSGSHVSVSGPSAAIAAMVAIQISILGSFENFLAALVIAGAIQVVMGLLKIGFIGSFFPNSVIKGLLFSVGTIIILKQIPHLFGIDLDYEGDMSFLQPDHNNTFTELTKIFSNFHLPSVIIGIVCLSVLYFFNKYKLEKIVKLPAALIAVVIGILLSLILPQISKNLIIGSAHLVQVPLMENFNLDLFFTFPNFNFTNPDLYLASISLALVMSLETLLNLEAVDKIDKNGRKSPANRELIAQGIGNIVLGCVGGIPVTSAILRSSVNVNSNAKTKLSTIFHGLLLLVSVCFLPELLNKIPLSCLAGILIITGFRLADIKLFKQMYNQNSNQFLPFMITVLAILFSDLLIGILIGLVSSFFFILKSSFKEKLKVIEEEHHLSKRQRIVLGNQVTFLNRASLAYTLESFKNNAHIVIDATDTDYIDNDVLDLIKDFVNIESVKRNISVSLVGFKDSYNIDNIINYDEHITSEIQTIMKPKDVLETIKKGNDRLVRGQCLKRNLNRQIEGTKEGQYPIVAVLSCIDSRTPVELVFDLGIGDAFSIRMAGNIISPKVLGSLEFACAIAKAKLIVVMGHTKCGAVAAAIDCYKNNKLIEEETQCYNLGTIINDIQRVIKKESFNGLSMQNHEELMDEVIKQNVIQTMEDIVNKSPILNQLIDEEKIDIVGCIYDVNTGKASFLN